MGKDTQRRSAARKLRTRGDATDMMQEDEVQAGSNPATTSISDLGTSHRQASPYLTHEQLDAMEPSTKLILDVTHMLGKECKIYTVAGTLLETIEERADNFLGGARREMKQLYTSALEKIKKLDPRKLFEKMNTGTDTDILHWKLFSIECLHISVLQHVVSNTKLRVWVDNDDLSPAKRATRERARIVDISFAITAASQLRIFGLATRFATLPGPALSSSIDDELGNDDIVELDLEKMLGHPCVVSVPRALVKTRSDHPRSWLHDCVRANQYLGNVMFDVESVMCQDPQLSAMTQSSHTTEHKQNLDFLRTIIPRLGNDIPQNAISDFLRAKCVDLVVSARSLYNKPIPVRKSKSGPCPEATDLNDGNVESLLTETTLEMLHAFVIPDAVADKGGYIVAGAFRPGHGIENVHLEHSDLKPDDDIMLHLWQHTDSCMPIARLCNRTYIKELGDTKAAISKVGDAVMAHRVGKMQESRELPNHSSSIDQIRTDDPIAMKCLKEALSSRRVMSMFNHALYDTPARLYYTSDHQSADNDARTVAYLEHLKELCCKKLEKSNGADATV